MKKYITDINNNILFGESNIIETNNINESIEVYDKISKFYGMGGALTHASTVNYKLLDNTSKEDFIKSYFEDLNYKYIRLPIGSCDFSPISYYHLVNLT